MEGLLEKVDNLMKITLKKKTDDTTLDYIKSLLPEHSYHWHLGRFFGYSVSEYAFATLFWIGNDDSLALFNHEFAKLSKERKERINELIKLEYYKQY